MSEHCAAGWMGRRGGRPSTGRGFVRLTIWIALLMLVGCSTPIGTTRTGFRDVYKELSYTALDDRLSDAAVDVLRRVDLEAQFQRDPEGTLQRLHGVARGEDSRDVLYALAELNYDHAAKLDRSGKADQRQRARDYFLSSALYAWFYLFGDASVKPPTAFDERFRVSCNLYNRAVARSFVDGPQTNRVVRPAGGPRQLPAGRVEVQVDEETFRSNLDRVEELLPADDYLVRGMSVRNRRSGLGAPLIAVVQSEGESISRQRVAVTLFLRVAGDFQEWGRGELRASLEAYSGYGAKMLQVGAVNVPLESDTTAPIAHRLNSNRLWKLGSAQFFSSEEIVKNDLYTLGPYQPGRVPVIFVHGTFSSPVWWAEMGNTLAADPVLRERCQFWFFNYNSGNPVAMSAANLRSAIEQKLQLLDPQGADAALQRMVVIGHSQGGLLAKFTAVDTGEQLWRAISDQDFETIPVPAEDRERVRRSLFVKPLPSVKRVVFIATPHRGSYRNSRFVQRLLGRFVTLPGDVLRWTSDLAGIVGPSKLPDHFRERGLNSLFGMSVSNQIVLTLAGIPMAPGVKCHSIIAIRGDGPPEQGDDGVVKYSSAHLDYADSEFIVRSGHSCQGKLPTINEVRRILREHLASLPPTAQDRAHPDTVPGLATPFARSSVSTRPGQGFQTRENPELERQGVASGRARQDPAGTY